MVGNIEAETQAQVDALLGDSLRESHEVFITQIWGIQADFIAKGRGFSGDMNYAARRAGENELSKRAALIEDAWRRVLAPLGGAVAEIEQEFLHRDAEARLRSSSVEIEQMVRSAITHRDSDPEAPTGLAEKVAVSIEALKASLSLLLAEARSQGFSGQTPNSIKESLEHFRKDYPTSQSVGFLMMRFGKTKAHESIVIGVRKALDPFGIAVVRADDKDYHEDLFGNVLTCVHGCGFGIAVFERLESDEFNPNVALEVGYMLALRKPVCLLKDKTLKALPTDLMGKLYKDFDPQNPIETIPHELSRWAKDKGLLEGPRTE